MTGSGASTSTSTTYTMDCFSKFYPVIDSILDDLKEEPTEAASSGLLGLAGAEVESCGKIVARLNQYSVNAEDPIVWTMKWSPTKTLKGSGRIDVIAYKASEIPQNILVLDDLIIKK